MRYLVLRQFNCKVLSKFLFSDLIVIVCFEGYLGLIAPRFREPRRSERLLISKSPAIIIRPSKNIDSISIFKKLLSPEWLQKRRVGYSIGLLIILLNASKQSVISHIIMLLITYRVDFISSTRGLGKKERSNF